MIEIGSRRRSLPPTRHIVYQALTEPDRDPARPWLFLLADEQRPEIIALDPPDFVAWSSLWERRPDAIVEFRLSETVNSDTNLRWTLLVDDPAPDDALTGHVRHRMNALINRDLRLSFGQ